MYKILTTKISYIDDTSIFLPNFHDHIFAIISIEFRNNFYTNFNLVTSQSPNGNDSVSLISYSEDDHQINRQIFKVPDNCGESWRIASSPKNETRFATSSSIVTECEKGYKQSWRCNIYQFDNEKITNDNTTATLGLEQLRFFTRLSQM